MQNAPFTKAIKEKLFDSPKHHPKLGKVKEYETSNSKNARNTKRQNLKPVKNDRSGLLVLKAILLVQCSNTKSDIEDIMKNKEQFHKSH